MAALTDRLDYVLGKKAAGPLEEHFGIRTVNDLLRHYPRTYSDGMSVRGEGEELDLEEGEHVTFVDVITDTKVGTMKPQPGKRPRKWLRVTLGRRRPNVTATFFNADWMIDKLPEGTRLMLSGEVGYFKGATQLTHPAFLVLSSPSGKEIGTKSLKTIADSSGATGDDLLAVFERELFPIYPASAKVQSWNIYACVRQVLDVLDPVEDPLPESFLRQRNLISEDEALRAIHLAENAAQRDRARDRLTIDEAIGLQWGLVARRYGELSETGPVVAPKDDGLLTAMLQQLPFELTKGQHEVFDVLSAELAASRPMNRMLQGEVGSGKTIVSVLAMLQMIDGGYQCA
ncbi:MAG: ATP-dependent helicase RecG, partial [Mycobacterium sp.]|nr:ATP-dependent helicase RecG [Mycobacterium sp.]